VKRAVVLLSGGLDSTTCLALAMQQGFTCSCLLVDYGQRHRVELSRAKRVAKSMGVKDVRTIKLNLREFGGSALTDDIAVPKNRKASQMSHGIPVTYVPARNTVFLALALGLAETLGAFDLFIGVNAVDYSGYPDCRPEFIKAFEKLARLATKAGVEGKRFTVHAPLSGLTKAQIIKRGLKAGVDYSKTHSCYDPVRGRACGRCDSCLIRKKGFEDAKVKDPTRYALMAT
jgi:7-cyano-7-deazaguanine synthase